MNRPNITIIKGEYKMKVKVKLDSENLIELVEQDMAQATDSSTAQIYVTAAVANAILALVATIKEESNKEKELKNAYFLRDEEQKRNRVLEQRLKEEISKNQIFDNAIYKIAKMVKPYKENPYKYTPKDYYCLLNQIQELIEVVIVQTTEEEYKGGEGDGSST